MSYNYNNINIFKSHQVIVDDDNLLVIDNNERVAKKIEHLAEQMVKEAHDAESQDILEGFTTGLDAEQVEALTSDAEEAPPAILKAASAPADAAEGERNTSAEALAVVSAQAEEMLAAARREAESIKSHALAEVQADIEKLRQTTLEEAKARGYEEGYQTGIGEVEEQKRSLSEEKKRMEAEYQQMVDELEPKFVDVLTDIYEKVFSVDLKKQHDIIMHLLTSTMHKIEGSSSYLIHVSKEDYSYVNLKKNEVLTTVLPANASIEVVEDLTLDANDCIIETDGGVFDCGLGTQLEDLSQKLKLLSYRRN